MTALWDTFKITQCSGITIRLVKILYRDLSKSDKKFEILHAQTRQCSLFQQEGIFGGQSLLSE
jgi:hypothetical protein